MLNQDYADDSLQMILDELSEESAQPSLVPAKIENQEIEHLDREQLEDYIIKSGVETVSTTQDIINVLLQQIRSTPDAELITSVAEMIGSKTKAVENLTKIFLNNEKLKQAKELEEFKQAAKLQQINMSMTRPPMTREEVMKLLDDDIIPEIRTVTPENVEKEEDE